MAYNEPMGHVRKHMKDAKESDLLQMWDDGDAWEETGDLADDAMLRSVTQRLFGAQNVLTLQHTLTEVWREVARRRGWREKDNAQR